MKMLKIATLTLVGAVPLLPAIATAQHDSLTTAQDENLTLIEFSQSAFFGLEGQTIEFRVAKKGPAEARIRWTTSDDPNIDAASAGEDYVASSATLFFAADDTEKTITVQTIADADVTEGLEVFVVRISLDGSGGDGQVNEGVEMDPLWGFEALGFIFPN